MPIPTFDNLPAASTPNSPDTPGHRAWLPNLLWTLPFLLLYWIDIAHHQMWFDELNAWGLAVASPDLKTLLHDVRYEGHPWLWYFLLWLPSRFTDDPVALKWVVAPIGTCVYLAIGMLSPFTRAQKVLLFLSYFVAFEYTVTLRMYGIMFLLALWYAWRRSHQPEAILGNVAILALMTNTDMTGVLLSGALLLEYTYTLLTAKEGAVKWPRLVPAILVYAAFLGVSILSLLPAPDISWQSTGHLGEHAFELRPVVFSFANVVSAPWWPISHEFPRRFWETHSHLQHALLWMVPFVLFAYWHTFRRRRNLLLLMAATVAVAFLFADFVYVGRVRHWGICYVSFVVGLWLQTARRKPVNGDRTSASASWSPWAFGLMTMSAFAGVVAVVSTWTHPYSQSKAASLWIERNEPATMPITGEPDVSFISVALQLRRPVYLMECGCVDTFKLFSHARENFSEEEMGSRLALALDRLHSPRILFILYRPLSAEDVARLRAHSLTAAPLASFTGADLYLESYYLYSIARV